MDGLDFTPKYEVNKSSTDVPVFLIHYSFFAALLEKTG